MTIVQTSHEVTEQQPPRNCGDTLTIRLGGTLLLDPLAHRDERIDTLANWVTLIRTVAATVLAVIAVSHDSLRVLIAAYLVYWLGDMLDGKVARTLHQETRIGAVFDIISDRTCTTLCAAAFILQFPEALLPITVFLIQFCVVDTMLSLTFLCFPIKSPNYFHLVDRTLYRLNWSTVAKSLNTSVVVLLSLTGFVLPATAFAVVILGMKVWSIRYFVTTVWPMRTSLVAPRKQQPVA